MDSKEDSKVSDPSSARSAEGGGSRHYRGYLAIGLVSCAVLTYEIAITRVLSVVLWYHFAFLSLSVAMLGLGASGVWFALRKPRPHSLRLSLFISSIAIPLSIIAIVKCRPLFFGGEVMSTGWVCFIVVCLLVPMLALGAAICLLLIQARGRTVGWMYGADLLGAMVGSLLVLPLMWWIPTPLLVAACGVLPAAASLLLYGRRAFEASAATLVIVACAAWGAPFSLHYTKQYDEGEGLEPVYERWTPTARITLHARPIYMSDRRFPYAWGLGRNYRPTPRPQMWVEQDGSAGTPIEQYYGNKSDLRHLFFDVTSIGYQLRIPKSVCVIGAGGGRDILTAHLSGATAIDAVELNAGIVEAVSSEYADFSGDPYHLPGVNAVVSEGRSFLERTDATYDLLQISLVDSWAATAAGAFALSENYLYTVDAVELYWDRLADDGVLSISRWLGGGQQLESARLVLMVEEALRRSGVTNPREHVVFVGASKVGTLLVAKQPFTEARLAMLDAINEFRGFDRHWPRSTSTPESSLVSHILEQGPAQLEARGLDLSPPTDDRPFFFQTVSLLGSPDAATRTLFGPNEKSVKVLRILVAALIGLAIVLFFAPFALQRRLERHAGFWRGSGYFAAIGLAFMLVEISWMQRSILYLGHPAYAAAVVIASLLLGAGAGSMAAARVEPKRVRRLAWSLPVVLVAVNLVLGGLFASTLGASTAVRILVAVAVFVPCGLLMGFAFPSGMIRFGDDDKAWFWAINGAFSVVASALSLALAMLWGLTAVAFVGIAAYFVAAWLVRDLPTATNDAA